LKERGRASATPRKGKNDQEEKKKSKPKKKKVSRKGQERPAKLSGKVRLRQLNKGTDKRELGSCGDKKGRKWIRKASGKE